MALLDEEIERERQKIKEDLEKRAREIASQQKKKDLEDAAAAAVSSRQSLTQFLYSSLPFRRSTPSVPVPPILTPADPQQAQPGKENPPGSRPGTPAASSAPETKSRTSDTKASEIPLPGPSPSEMEWQRQKDIDNVSNEAIDKIMEMIGLEEVKSQVLRIKAKIDTAIRQNTDFKEERLGVTLLGNPGTGMLLFGHICTGWKTNISVRENHGCTEIREISKHIPRGTAGN
jgi:hypothetical protein